MPLSGIKPNSDSAVVRNTLDEIEAALTAGVSREDVFQALKAEHGLTFGFNGFCQALKRARAKTQKRSTPSGDGQSRTGPNKADVLRKTENGLRNTEKVDCAIQKEHTPDAKPDGQAPKDRIISKKDFAQVHSMDFSDLDVKYRK